MWASESAFMVALGVVAFRDGGVAAVGAVTAARMAAAALLAPFLATMADRVRRERVLVVRRASSARRCSAAAAAVTAADGPTAATYAFAVVATIAMTLFRPAHSALLPALAKSPQELTGANAVRGMLDSLATLGGPLDRGRPARGGAARPLVFAACAAASLLAGARRRRAPLRRAAASASRSAAGGRAMLEGFATIAADRTARADHGARRRRRRSPAAASPSSPSWSRSTSSTRATRASAS